MDDFRIGSDIISSNNPLKNDISGFQRIPFTGSNSNSINPLMKRIVNENLNSN
ncbi:MAG: hypothetical protein NZM44_00445 [Candidatus Calescibacterium sp.]|nr:hypothetical protein [Candidatus Calescibacterium sp.]